MRGDQMSLQGPPGPPTSSVEPEDGHVPVMVEEVMAALSPISGNLHIDATLGGGGHARRILEATSPDGRLLGLDADRAAIARAGARLADFGERVTLRQTNFEGLKEAADETGFSPADGVLFDLGLVLQPAGRHGARLQFPRRRPARHALRHITRPARRAGRERTE